MAVTLEQVEKLREKADVSYEQARQVLEQAQGDLLEALILLERQGLLRPEGRGASYSTRPAGAEPPGGGASAPNSGQDRAEMRRSLVFARPGAGGEKAGRPGFCEQLRELLAAGMDLLRHATVNQFQVWRRGEMMTSMPVLILVLLVVVAFWVSVPLLVLGLFCGCKYRFAGPDLDENQAGETANRVADTIQGVVEQVRDGFQKASRRDKNNR